MSEDYQETNQQQPNIPNINKKFLLIIIFSMIIISTTSLFIFEKRLINILNINSINNINEVENTFLPLENIVVNLIDNDKKHYAQIGITLELKNKKSLEKIKKDLPNIQNKTLLLLSQLSYKEILEKKGKEKLASNILKELSKRNNNINQVLFTNFIIQ